MWLAQRAHVEAHVRAGLSPACVVIDGRPAPTFEEHGVIAMPYCDNGNILALSSEAAEVGVEKVMRQLRSWRLDLQDITGAVLKTESLGVYIDGERGLVRPSWKRLSNIVSACDFMSRRPRVTSKQLERLIGHITYIALLSPATVHFEFQLRICTT